MPLHTVSVSKPIQKPVSKPRKPRSPSPVKKQKKDKSIDEINDRLDALENKKLLTDRLHITVLHKMTRAYTKQQRNRSENNVEESLSLFETLTGIKFHEELQEILERFQ